jgi:hypothetical protein
LCGCSGCPEHRHRAGADAQFEFAEAVLGGVVVAGHAGFVANRIGCFDARMCSG